MNYDVLFNRPDYIKKDEINQKQGDVENSAKAALITGTFMGLAIYLEFSKGYAAILATLTVALISCWHNESKRLAIMKTIPTKNSNPSDNSPRFSSLSPKSSPSFMSPRSASLGSPTQGRRAISAPLPLI
jgi:hypothetical protein